MSADSLVNQADKTIRWNLENPDFYQAMFKNILRPHEDIGVDFWWVDWQQWMIANNFPDLGNTFWINHVFYLPPLGWAGQPPLSHRLLGRLVCLVRHARVPTLLHLCGFQRGLLLLGA